MALHLQLASRADALLPGLVDWLAPPPADPFQADVVVVPNAGVRDWLRARLGEHLGATARGGDGVCANVTFLYPGAFTSAALGHSRPDDDPWAPDALAFTVLDVLHHGELEAPGFPPRRGGHAYARRAADLFDRYATQRPEMLAAWATGADVDAAGPPDDQALDASQVWQARLFRAVRERLGPPSPAERTLELRADLARGALRPALPERVALFGLGTTSAGLVTVVSSLASDRPVGLFVLHPSPGVAVRARPVDSLRPPLRPSTAQRAEDHDPSGARHPLLRSWGLPSVESAALLAGVADLGAAVAEPAIADAPDTPGAPKTLADSGDTPAAPPTLLARLQHAVADDLPPPTMTPSARGAARLDGGDGTVQIHSCHGPTRQVQVLRDALLHLLAADPTLRPADIAVVCPDLDTFAPLVEPVLGAALGADRLPVVVSDRSLTTRTAVATALDGLFAVAADRCSVADVAGVLALPAVARAVHLDADDLARLDRWASELAVSWGLDPAHRIAWCDLATYSGGTWRQAVDRLLVGALVQSAEPVEALPGLAAWDDLAGDDLAPLGRLADALDGIGALVGRLAGPHSMAAWCDAIGWVLDRFVAVTPTERWQVDEALELLDTLRHQASPAATVPLTASEVRELLASRLGTVSGRTRLRTGAVTVASLTPLRGVPFRVVAVLGLDDTARRGAGVDGDDVLGRRPLVGERDPAAEQRLALLDAVMAARDHLVVTCTGRDVTSNEPVPLPVVLDELLDAAADEALRTPTATRGRPLLVSHPRQLADPANLGADPGVGVGAEATAGRPIDLVNGGPWTFDVGARVAATALLAASQPDDPGAAALPVPPAGELTLRDVFTALRHPARTFLRDRLDVSLPHAVEDDGAGTISLVPSPLLASDLGRDLLAGLRAPSTAPGGAPSVGEVEDRITAWRHLRSLLGGLPPLELGDLALDTAVDEVSVMLGYLAGLDAATEDVAVEVVLADGSVLVDRVPVHGEVVLEALFTRHHRRNRLRPWLRLAALTATDPGRDWSALLVERGPSGKAPVGNVLTIAGTTPEVRRERAHGALEVLTDLRRRIRCAPVPVFARTTWELDQVADAAADRSLGYDSNDVFTAWLHPGVDVALLRSEPLTDLEQGLPPAKCRASCYAAALHAAWVASVVETKAPPPEDAR